MGAIHKFDLTSDVTHLIVGDSDTPKYRFVAKEREDVQCLLPSWVEAVRLSWMEGGDTDVASLERQYQLPTFAGLRICVTGFEDLAHRKKLEDLINEYGGEYRGNLTRDVTHLIAKEPAGNKYTYAGQWGVKIVSVEWLQQSFERGMILDETLFHLHLPPAERGRNAWIRKAVSTTSLGKRPREGGLERTNSRKLRRTASARLSNESSGIWSNIVGDSIKQEIGKPNEWHDSNTQDAHEGANDVTPKVPQTSGEQRLHRDLGDMKNQAPVKPPIARNGGIFEGTKIILHRFDEKRSALLQHHLCSHGGEILSEVSELPKASTKPQNSYFLLVPHQTVSSDVPTISSLLHHPIVATEMWVERCLFSKEMVHPSKHIANEPFANYPIKGFERLSISTTAFQGTDMLHTSRTIQLMGAHFTEDLTPSSSVLICNKILPKSEKRQSALRWNVPTVTLNWLLDCIQQGTCLPFDLYLTQPFLSNPPSLPHNPSKPDSRPSEDSKNPSSQDKQPNATVGTRPFLKKKPSTSNSAHTPQDPSSSSTTAPKNSHQTNPPPPKPSTASLPLQPISPNASPKPSPSPPKPPHSKTNPLPIHSAPHSQKPLPTKSPSPIDSTLGPAISSLLAHHRASKASAAPPPRRRRRQLLGRAPSNLSARSLSRASSVDTMNTDGVGTPLSGSFSHANPNRQPGHLSGSNSIDITTEGKKLTNIPDPFAQIRAYDAEVEAMEKGGEGEEMQMTQLGYEDLEGRMWRERVVRKMGGEIEVDEDAGRGAGEGRGAKREVVRDERKEAGVAGRTRAGGRG